MLCTQWYVNQVFTLRDLASRVLADWVLTTWIWINDKGVESDTFSFDLVKNASCFKEVVSWNFTTSLLWSNLGYLLWVQKFAFLLSVKFLAMSSSAPYLNFLGGYDFTNYRLTAYTATAIRIITLSTGEVMTLNFFCREVFRRGRDLFILRVVSLVNLCKDPLRMIPYRLKWRLLNFYFFSDCVQIDENWRGSMRSADDRRASVKRKTEWAGWNLIWPALVDAYVYMTGEIWIFNA